MNLDALSWKKTGAVAWNQFLYKIKFTGKRQVAAKWSDFGDFGNGKLVCCQFFLTKIMLKLIPWPSKGPWWTTFCSINPISIFSFGVGNGVANHFSSYKPCAWNLFFLEAYVRAKLQRICLRSPSAWGFVLNFPTWFRSYRQCMAMFQSLQWMSPDSWDKAVVQPITTENDETRSRWLHTPERHAPHFSIGIHWAVGMTAVLAATLFETKQLKM